MIQSFRCKKTRKLYEDGDCDKRFRAFQRSAERALRKLEAAVELIDLRQPPSNRFEALHGDREGQCSIRINDKWRLCFTWGPSGAENVEIVDYH
ncbi:plasmid maintenance system killer (plasmid) [Solidesulfovibrio carbinoliphilus subsp. oakridgensis]|uniref:Plasmid maintenance system killer n=1 Tax=Solidesulfovibrio carbinoliphilus subsp. oakridgensis TaxID=694327 RepID=G7QE91_9BACT|nr:type II toxin-antitoxin system RelE/ParE family toxin [Solidesulfovibrio carbinoliphilus]EHJ45985.1 plasmid maintenance system killer [Solidesulfovibrio carbinoliphilus subsp. oakridgensis]